MESPEHVTQSRWWAMFRVNHGGSKLAGKLSRSVVLEGLQPHAIDRDEHLTDVVFRLYGDNTSAVLGRAAVTLWDLLETERVPSPVVEAVMLSDGRATSMDCTQAYAQLRDEHLDLLAASPDLFSNS